MGFDGILTSKLSLELINNLKQGKINKISQLDKHDFIFDIRNLGKSHSLYISVSPSHPTMFLTDRQFDKPYSPPAFCMLLRKHLEGGIITDISQINGDRIISISVSAKNEYSDTIKRKLIIELIGRFANFLLLDEEGKIIDCIKHLSILDGSKRVIMKGMLYLPPEVNKLLPSDEKLDAIFEARDSIYTQNLIANIMGLSPIFANYLVEKYQSYKGHFMTMFRDLLLDHNPTILKDDFYFIDIFNSSNTEHKSTISEVLDTIYKNEYEYNFLKESNSVIFKTIKNNIAKYQKKLVKLNADLASSLNASTYRLYGELLTANSHIKDTTNPLELTNYYDNNQVKIPIDLSISLIDNANAYFKRYKKAKNAITHLEAQLQIVENDLRYFISLQDQLAHVSKNDLIEIKQELEKDHFLKNDNKNKKPVKKTKVPNYSEYVQDNTNYLVGKNHLQNDYLTHKLAKPNEYWFHIKEGTGSHVIARTIALDEKIIRTASNLAALFSTFSSSSSVAVDYTLVKNIKKVPGQKGSFVTYKEYKTIYIDPDESLLATLKKIK